MSKKGLLVFGIIFLIHTKSSALTNPTRNNDSANGTSRVSLQGVEDPAIFKNERADLRLYEPITRTLNQFAFGGVLPRIRRRRWANGTFSESLENDIYYVAEKSISVPWKVLTTPLFVFGNAIAAPITSFAEWVDLIINRLADILLALIWVLTKNVVLPNADKTLMKLARGNVFPESVKQLIISIHFFYELLKYLGYCKPMELQQ